MATTRPVSADLLDAILRKPKQVLAVVGRSCMPGASIERTVFPLAGSKAFRLSPDANQTC